MIAIVTDSSSDLPADIVARHSIEIVPLTIRFGDREYVDRVELDTEGFWELLEAGESLPETAAPSAGAFLDAFARLAEAGVEGVLAICISSDLSATYQSAVIAAERLADSSSMPVRKSSTVARSRWGSDSRSWRQRKMPRPRRRSTPS